MKRRAFLAGAIATGLGGCGISRSVDQTSAAIDFLWNGISGPEITRQQVADLPYATILGKIGRGPMSLLVLGRYDGEDLHWISADRNVLVTRNGRLMKTVGLPTNIVRTRLAGTDPLVSGAAVRAAADREVVRYIDVMPGGFFGVSVESAYETLGEERIEILGLAYDTVVVQERNAVPLMDWKHRNRFWIDRDTGFVWRSLQHFAPGIPPVEINVSKPATA